MIKKVQNEIKRKNTIIIAHRLSNIRFKTRNLASLIKSTSKA